jgi:hypothetical protein
MKILQRNLNRVTLFVWEMKRDVSVVRLIVVTRSSGPPTSQPGSVASGTPVFHPLSFKGLILQFIFYELSSGTRLTSVWHPFDIRLTSSAPKYEINLYYENGRVRTQLFWLKILLLEGRHVSAPSSGHKEYLKRKLYGWYSNSACYLATRSRCYICC